MAFDVSVGLGTWAEHQGQEQPQAHPYEESMENVGRLLLDSRGVDLTIVYNAIFASHRLLDGLIFQGPYSGFARCRRTFEHKTLESNKSLVIVTTKRPPQKDDHLVRERHDRVLQRMLFFSHCNAPVVWHHLRTDDRRVR